MAGMYGAVDLHQPDQIIHLGDYQQDAERLRDAYPDIPVCSVPGNCDGWTTEPLVRRITLGGKTFLLSHGHIWHVKSGYEQAIAEGRKAGASVLLFGHTHRAECFRTDDGLTVMNPGTSRLSYGLIVLEGSSMDCSIQKV